MEYSYPLDETWSTEEVVDAVNFYALVEKAYDQGVKQEVLMLSYTRFKQIVPSKSEEKQLCGKFEKETGYSCYHTMKKAKELSGEEIVRM